ncbi:MAG: CorA family divalent cation transporter [Candidatus Absconditabacterales bacterium]|nr:CorA family divalent cation transporter [Candidatus Absconditabacterales bacterium]
MTTKNLISLGNIQRFHFVQPNADEITSVLESYDVHDLILKDSIDPDVHEKIDIYDHSIFFVLTFPKFDHDTKKYIANKILFLVRDNLVITIASHPSSHIEAIVSQFEHDIREKEEDEDYMISSYYLIYTILDTLYSKIQKLINRGIKHIRQYEDFLFSSKEHTNNIILELGQKQRNSIYLKHLLESHVDIMQDLHTAMKTPGGGQFDVYFEDLIFKLEKLIRQHKQYHESLASLFSSLRIVIDLQTDHNVVNLTRVTVLLGTFAVITGYFGMNVRLPGAERPWTARLLAAIFLCGALIAFWHFTKPKNT